MVTRHSFSQFVYLICCVSIWILGNIDGLKASTPDMIELKGQIVDVKTGNPLPFASVSLIGTNVSVVSNSEGVFLLKLSPVLAQSKALFSYIGYKNKQVEISDLKSEKNRIALEASSVLLPELNVRSKDASELVKMMLDRKEVNYLSVPTLMTAFYRESIRKNRSYVSLSEAIVEVQKQSCSTPKVDVVRLYKSRKKADYQRMDTLAFKLMGGPFNTLYLDVMKYPEVLFTNDMMANYVFSFDHSTYVDKQPVYIIDFKQKTGIEEPLYYGKLYIDGRTYALRSAIFNLNITNKDEAANLFIMKKPFNARVYPVEAKYRIDYIENDGKWYYNYSRVELGLKINWKRKLFNTTYYSTVEMAVTDRGATVENISRKFGDKIKPSVIISDEASGFADPQFWGEFNVIEPEKTIDVAIRKIQKQLEQDK